MVEHLNHFSPKEDLNANHETVRGRELNFVMPLFLTSSQEQKNTV